MLFSAIREYVRPSIRAEVLRKLLCLSLSWLIKLFSCAVRDLILRPILQHHLYCLKQSTRVFTTGLNVRDVVSQVAPPCLSRDVTGHEVAKGVLVGQAPHQWLREFWGVHHPNLMGVSKAK